MITLDPTGEGHLQSFISPCYSCLIPSYFKDIIYKFYISIAGKENENLVSGKLIQLQTS